MTDVTAYIFDDFAAEVERAEEERCARRTWGHWHLDTDTLELIYRADNGGACYFIDLERVTTSAAMLDWIFQLRMKTWTTPTDIGELADALYDIFDPQAMLCSFGATGRAGKTIDATGYLRRRYGAPERRAAE